MKPRELQESNGKGDIYAREMIKEGYQGNTMTAHFLCGTLESFFEKKKKKGVISFNQMI